MTDDHVIAMELAAEALARLRDVLPLVDVPSAVERVDP